VGFEVARELHAPLDVFVVRKLGLPGHEELAMGALATGGVRVINDELVRALRLSETVVEAVTARERGELERRERLYRGDGPALDVCGRTDDFSQTTDAEVKELLERAAADHVSTAAFG